MSNEPLVTIVVAPRERFSMARSSLKSLQATLPPGTPVIYVDGGSPESLHAWLKEQTGNPDFTLIRKDFILTQHETYNLAIPHVKTRYVICVDNDVLFRPGWLEEMLACAETTGAWVVTPVYLEADAVGTRIHVAGGSFCIEDIKGIPTFAENHNLAFQPEAKADALAEHTDIDLIEYHTFLARMDIFPVLGPFDPALKSAKDHVDFSLLIKAAGGTIRMARNARITYQKPPPFKEGDLRFFFTRWSERWNQESFDHFSAKWGIHAPLTKWFGVHRRTWLLKWTRWLVPFIGPRAAGRLTRRLLDPLIAPWETRRNRQSYPLPQDLSLRAQDPDLRNPGPGFWGAPLGKNLIVRHARRVFRSGTSLQEPMPEPS